MKASAIPGGKASANGKVSRASKAAARPNQAAVAAANAAAALDARQAEIRWLTQQYSARIRTLLADNEALRQRVKVLTTAAEAAESKSIAQSHAPEIQALQVELAHLVAANERYLLRIYELKAQIASAGKS